MELLADCKHHRIPRRARHLNSVSLRSMSAWRICGGTRRTVASAVLGALLAAPARSMQTPPGPPSAGSANAITRACSANPVLTPTASKKTAHKSKHPLPPEPLPTCLEVKGEGIEIQEFLQTTAREQSWRIGENHSSEDTWSFVRYFDSEELEKYADTKVLIEPVKFTSGKAAVTIRTTDLNDGYSRVQISVHFLGEGKSTDKAWGQPTSQWVLSSKGVQEQELGSALQTHFKPVE
jgi:hypothetical protein